MNNDLLVKLDNLKQFTNEYVSYIRSRPRHRNLIMLCCCSITFLIILLFNFNSVSFVFPRLLSEKIHYTSTKNLVNNSKTMRDKAQGPPTCLIIIRTADGGLGNRMFLFASAYGVARLHQCQLYVAPWILTDLRSVFLININQTKVHLTTDDSLVVNRTDIYGRYSACTFYHDLFKIPFNSTFKRYEMIGFYQAYGYFEKYKEEIAYLFQFNSGSISKNVPLVAELLKG